MASPVKPSDAAAIIPDPTSSKCAAFTRALLQLPVLFYKLLNWLLDADGNLTVAFLRLAQPVGSYEFSSFALPTGTYRLFCDGSAVSRTTYADLFAAIGTTYGAGDASTTFNVPDFRGRFPMCADGTHAIATTGGEATHVLVEAELPAHKHGLVNSGVAPAIVDPGATDYVARASFLGGNSEEYSLMKSNANAAPDMGVTGPTGSDTAHNNLPPYMACYVYIRM